LFPVDAIEHRLIGRCLDGFPNERFTVYLLATLDLAYLVAGSPETSPGNFMRKRAETFSRLRDLLEGQARSLRAAGHTVETVVEVGPPEQVSRDFICAIPVDLVVLQRWRPSLLRKSLGQRLAENVNCPVLLVSA
jgi:nucleotide-binding universal stress UspA family protein